MKKMNKQKVLKLISFCVFVIIVFHVFLNVTYLFRPENLNRRRMAGLEQENVDIVYIGGSAAFVYWEPLRAWNDCGYTSYNYGTDTIQAESIKAHIEEARKSQDPELFVIGLRAFQYYSDDWVEEGIRNSADSMDVTSMTRYGLLNEYFRNRTIPEDVDALSYYLDIVKYHTNTKQLGSKASWKLINNNNIDRNKGWYWFDRYAYLDLPEDYETDERAELPEKDIKILEDLLKYCKSEKLNVLFVVCPYWITKDHWAKYNKMEDIIQEYGFQYLNANEYFDEMNLDFSTDFYNKNHVNLFGARKYTEFLEDYISKNYDITNHKGDIKYASWDEDYKNFLQEEEKHSVTVMNLKTDVEKTYEIQEQMKNATSLAEWDKLARDTRFTLLLIGTKPVSWPTNIADQQIFSDWGIAKNSNHYIRVVKGGQILSSNAQSGALTADGTLGIWDDTSYHISVQNEEPIATFNSMEVSLDKTKMNLLVYENNYRQLVGNVTLSVDENGKVMISYN